MIRLFDYDGGTDVDQWSKSMGAKPIHVIKLGGSLLDLPDLPERFEAIASKWRGRYLLLVVGGGRAADLVRACDDLFGIEETQGHWLAIRAMQLNTHVAASIFPGWRGRIVTDVAGCARAWRSGEVALVDPLIWLEREEVRGITTPHCWTFTSDSIAAHIAARLRAEYLTLLKSTLPTGPLDIDRATACGLVDPEFATASRDLGSMEVINLRADPPACSSLR